MPDGADRLRGQPPADPGSEVPGIKPRGAIRGRALTLSILNTFDAPFLLASAFERCLWLDFVMNFLTRALLGKTVISNKALTSAYTPQPMGNGRAHV
jgi:hypothetical protein